MKLSIGNDTFHLHLHQDLAPLTCAALLRVLPFESKLIQARWSGEACWSPLGDLDLEVPIENEIHAPTAGQLLYYPKGLSETEIYFPYGENRFACKFGPLSGNHFATIEAPAALIRAVGERVLYEGAKALRLHL